MAGVEWFHFPIVAGFCLGIVAIADICRNIYLIRRRRG